MTNGSSYLAEAIGTFALVFAGCGAIVVNEAFPGMLGHVGVCTVFGLIVMAMIYSFGEVSGAHINPAVTLAFAFARRLEFRTVLIYIACQFAGALTAALCLRAMFPGHETLGATMPSGSPIQSFAMEVLLSFLLMIVILNVSTGHREAGIMAGVAVGGTVALDALIGGPVSGASMNPARSLGPAVISGHVDSLWIYVSAPVLGMVLACPVCRCIRGNDCCSGRAPVLRENSERL